MFVQIAFRGRGTSNTNSIELLILSLVQYYRDEILDTTPPATLLFSLCFLHLGRAWLARVRAFVR